MPIGLVGKGRCARLGAAYNQAVKSARPQIVEVLVVLIEIPAALLRAWRFRQRKQSYLNRDSAGRGAQQFLELPLRGFQCTVRHVVDEADDNRSACGVLRHYPARFPTAASRA